jgi:hypothetical protein
MLPRITSRLCSADLPFSLRSPRSDRDSCEVWILRFRRLHRSAMGRWVYTRKSLATCQQDVFATGFVASLSTSCNNAVILSSCYKVVTHNLSTRCVRNRLVASLSTSCNNAVILSSCYMVVIYNLSTRCVCNRLCSKLVNKL